jgi:hypothetical protein
LTGGANSVDQPCPTAGQLLAELLGMPSYSIESAPNNCGRYFLRFGTMLECRFPVHLISHVLELKLAGYCQHWQATVSGRDKECVSYRVYSAPGFWQRCLGTQGGLEIQVQLPSGHPRDTLLSEILVRVQVFGMHGPKARDLLVTEGPVLLESLRAFLQSADKRARGRIGFTHPVRAFPVLMNRTIGGIIQGQAKNISLGGMGVLLDSQPAADLVYLNAAADSPADPFALLARVVRARATARGKIEVGASFVVDDSWLS